MKRPILVDLAQGRVGTYLKTGESSLANHISIHYTPLDSIRKQIIYDVPAVAIKRCPIVNDATPKEGTMFLLSGNGGVSPVWEWLTGVRGEILEQVAAVQTRLQQSEAGRRIAEKRVQTSVDEVVKDQMEKTKELQKATNPFFGQGSEFGYRPKSLMDK